MSMQFYERLKKMGGKVTKDTICLQNTRLADKYLIFDLLALGKHSTIYYGIEEATGKEHVFKFYNLHQLENEHGFKVKEICKRLSNYEFRLSRKCASIHIINFCDAYEDRNSKVIVSEYCNLGSLADEIKGKKCKGTNQWKAIAILKQIVSALKNIHKNCRILHKNLKAQNILIQDGIYKLIDFGLPSIDNQEDDTIKVPEIIKNRVYGQKAEVWSLGVLFHQILFGELPRALLHHSKSCLIHSQVKNILDRSRIIESPNEVISFLDGCLQIHPQDRMSWLELEKHPIFQLIVTKIPKTITQKPKQIKNERISIIISIDEENIIESQEKRQYSTQCHEVEQSFYSQKFNLQQEIRAIEKKLEQPYENLGYNFEIKRLQPVSQKPLRKGIDKSSHREYQEIKSYYLQCLKVDFVYYDIIKVLKSFENFGESREQVQFLYLLFSRCFFEMSQLNIIIQKNKFKPKAQSVLIVCIKKQTQILYTQIKSGWENICKQMERLENQRLNKLKDSFAAKFHKQEYNQKNGLLTGIEGVDFTKEQQIQFTVKTYQQHVRKTLLQRFKCLEQNKKEANELGEQQLLVSYLDKYKELWKLTKLDECFLSVKDHMICQCRFVKN